jgi:hypothetical protein
MAALPPVICHQVTWSDRYPAESIPEGLRHSEVRGERSADGTCVVACKVYKWVVVVASWHDRGESAGTWTYQTCKVSSYRRVDNGGEVYSAVTGHWNAPLNRKLWRAWGPNMWCMVSSPEPYAYANVVRESTKA